MQRRMKVLVMVLGMAAVLLVAGGVALAAIPSSDGTISACYKNVNGLLRVIDSEAGDTCLNGSETPISWNQQGLPGPAGPQGLPGASGVSGWEKVSASAAGNTAVAVCPSGKKALGGGVRALGSGFRMVIGSFPTGSGNGWIGEVDKLDPADTTLGLDVYAICASVAP